MPHFLITARCHVLDTNLFEQFIVLLIPWIKSHSAYAYSVEEDMTINRHIHLLIEDNAKDRDAMTRKFTTKSFKQFKQHLTTTNTIWDTFLDIQVVKNTPEDFNKSLGYTLKDNTKRRGYSGFTESQILDATKYYYVSQHLDKSILKSDIKLITTKNIYGHVIDFCNKHKLKFTDPTIQLQMTQSKFGFVNISPKNIRRVFNELQVMHEQSNKYTDSIIIEEQRGLDEANHFQHENDICKLLEHVAETQSLDELPLGIQFLFKKYPLQ